MSSIHRSLAVGVLMTSLLSGLAAGAAAQSSPQPATADAHGNLLWVYVGTYTRTGSQGIYLLHLDLATGRLELAGLAAKLASPSFLSFHPTRPLLYAVSEMSGGGKKGGAVSALAIDGASGLLTLLNQQSSEGSGPCHVAVDRAGRSVLVCNYGDGVAACLPIQADGTLGPAASVVHHEGHGPNPGRQTGPHAHSGHFDPANRIALVCDLGIDRVMIYRYDADRHTLTPNSPSSMATAPGAGPRHLAFDPSGRHVYVINELASTISAFDYDAQRGALVLLQTISTLPPGYRSPNTTAEVQVHPSGRWVYGSNRGHDTIAAFAVEPDGRLRAIGYTPSDGRTPRNFAIDPTGKYILAANQDTGNVAVLHIDPKTGLPRHTGYSVDIPMAVCVKFRWPGP